MKFYLCDTENMRVVEPFPFRLSTPIVSSEPIETVVPKQNYLAPEVNYFSVQMDSTGLLTVWLDSDTTNALTQSVTTLGDYVYDFEESGLLVLSVNNWNEILQTFRTHYLKDSFLTGQDDSNDSITSPEYELTDIHIASFALEANDGPLVINEITQYVGDSTNENILLEFAIGDINDEGRFSGDTTSLEWVSTISDTTVEEGYYAQIFVKANIDLPIYGRYLTSMKMDVSDNTLDSIMYFNQVKTWWYDGETLYGVYLLDVPSGEYNSIGVTAMPLETEFTSATPITWTLKFSKFNEILEESELTDAVSISYTPGTPIACDVDYPTTVSFQDLGPNTKVTFSFDSTNHNAEELVVDDFGSIDVSNKLSGELLIEGGFEWDEAYTLNIYTRASRFGQSVTYTYNLVNQNHSVYSAVINSVQLRAFSQPEANLETTVVNGITLFSGYSVLYIEPIPGAGFRIIADEYGQPYLNVGELSLVNSISDFGASANDYFDWDSENARLYFNFNGRRVVVIDFVSGELKAQNFRQTISSVPVDGAFYAGSTNYWLTINQQVVFGWNATDLQISRTYQELS